MNEKTEPLKKGNKKTVWIVLILILLLLVGAGAYFFFFYREEAKSSVPVPVYSLDGGTYYGNQELILSTHQPDMEIYYTLDGTEPTENSLKYNKSIPLDSSVTVKSIAVARNGEKSDVAENSYTIRPKDGNEIPEASKPPGAGEENPKPTDYTAQAVRASDWPDTGEFIRVTATDVGSWPANMLDMRDYFEASASSELTYDNHYYYAVNAIDGNNETAWFEGSESDGEGETITLTYVNGTKDFIIREIYIINGYSQSINTFGRNAMPYDLLMYINAKPAYIIHLDLGMSPLCAVLPTPVAVNPGDTITFEMGKIYRGDNNKITDAAITEIAFD